MAPPPGERRTLVKVCGLTRLEDARAALESGADWLGFVVKADSPRCLDAALAADLVAALDAGASVAVMVAPDPDEAHALAARVGAARVQLHGVNPLHWPADFPLPVTFVIPVARDGALTQVLPPPGPLVMLDTAHPRHLGGTGERLPWETARIVAATREVVLAGGLDAECVAEALDRVRPFGVDASSRLESSPGIKDREKVRRFVAAVRAFDAADL